MKKLIDQCKDHDYLFLMGETVHLTEYAPKTIIKETYACVHCGTGLDFYNLDEPVEVSE